MLVKKNLERRLITISGLDGNGYYEIDLRWHEALNLGSWLQHAAHEIEPPAPAGRTYEPVAGR